MSYGSKTDATMDEDLTIVGEVDARAAQRGPKERLDADALRRHGGLTALVAELGDQAFGWFDFNHDPLLPAEAVTTYSATCAMGTDVLSPEELAALMAGGDSAV